MPAGRVTQVRLFLSDPTWLLPDGTALPVQCSSCDETGLKLVPSGSLEVTEGEQLTINLLIDSEQSLTFTPDEVRLRPVVHLEAHHGD